MKKITTIVVTVCVLLLIGTTLTTISNIPIIGTLKAKYIYENWNIQNAINKANDGDVIVVANGVYPGNINFLGKAIIVASENGSANCIIDGAEIQFGVKFDNNEGPDSILQGFTIENCRAEDGAGGGIYCGENTGPTIINCIITNNQAEGRKNGPEGRGGGIYCWRFSSPTIINCQIINNQVIGDFNHYANGGGIAIDYGSPLILNCLISNNIATYEGGVDGFAVGGGIAARYSASPVLKNCMIVENIADSSGGGMILRYGAEATIQGCTFSNNKALTEYWGGGALTCEHGSHAKLRSSILWNDYPQEIHIGGWLHSTVDIDFSDIQGGEEGVDISEQKPDFDHLIYGEMNIDLDPLFKNPDEGNYHLSNIGCQVSPCIDAGQPQKWHKEQYHPNGGEKDFDKEARVFDVTWITYRNRGPYDIGADEARLNNQPEQKQAQIR